MVRSTLLLLGIVAGIAALLLALLWLTQRRLIYLPDTSAVPPAAEVIAGAEDATLTTADGLDLGAWYVPAANDEREITVLVANGNGGNRAGRAPLARALSDRGFAVLLFDYRGYGGNPGHPDEEGLGLDAKAAYEYLTTERGVRAERLVYFGESLGCGVIAGLAAEHRPAGMLLRSPFPKLSAVAQRHYPFVPAGLLLRDRFPVAQRLGDIDVPITVVYGTEDGIVPPEMSLEVADAARGPITVHAIEGAGHNDATMFDGAELIDAVIELSERMHDR
ncbi:alpha/beta hydrolase [Phytoactinopolyspora alkaliphila]|uniref:Alpha/beta hydrolase n=1 Tax=Phytoactinopolyspora alkaliphila TaxID=1783498 RepID=A0A6N9YMN5_9ACTN|nr:alpha/beta hydrolase [Phytoactinopolyspora alkaliphila]